MLSELNRQRFEPLLGARFECRCPESGAPFDCELREATVLRADSGGENPRQPFFLLFLAVAEEVLPQQVYAVSHPEFAEPMALFWVPVGQADGGVLLEAVFN